MMTTAAAPLQRYGDVLAQAQPHLSGANLPWLSEQRGRAVAELAGMAFPQRRQEAWRYTSVERLLQHDFAPFAAPPEVSQDLDINALVLADTATHRLVFANGRYLPALSRLADLPAGTTVGSLQQQIEHNPIIPAKWLGQAASQAQHVFSAMNSAAIQDGLMIHIPRGQRLERPIEVVHLSLGGETAIACQPRTLVVLEPGAHATLVERFTSPQAQALYFNNGLSEIFLQEGATLEHLRLQDESPAAFHLHSVFVQQSAASRYHYHGYALGGSWARTEVNVEFRGRDATARLDGLYLAGEQQLTDVHLNIEHGVPGCESHTRFKGLLHGKGRAVFDGRIAVRPGARQTQAQLKNDNLLLSRHAEVDTKPQLEIYADDVKCSHGTTVGQLEPEQLFYLRSRGIDALQAQRMLCLGFAGEVLDRCPLPALRAVIEDGVLTRLAGAPGQ